MFGIPVWKKDYSNKKRVRGVCAKLSRYLQPGDFVNFEACLDNWWNVRLSFAWKLMWFDQKLVFGGNSRYKDEHTAVYLDEDHTFSMEPPKGRYKSLSEYCLEPITIYRYAEHKFGTQDIAVMRKIADGLVGIRYDIPQLANALFNTILGFPNYMQVQFFRKGLVCSVAARVIFEKWRKNWNAKHPAQKIARLFDKLNPDLNPPGALADRFHNGKLKEGVEYEMTSPAHFANSAFYAREFVAVATFNNGERMW
jgi:hypothetical protein